MSDAESFCWTVPRLQYVPIARRAAAVPDARENAASPATTASALQGASGWREVRAILSDSAKGRTAVRYIEAHHVPVVFARGGGSKWDGRTITIDLAGRSTASAAISIVHEVHHVRAARDGHSANVRTCTRAVYIDKMLDEEVRAKIDAIVARNELVANQKLSPSRYEAKDNSAFQAGMAALQQSNPHASLEQLAAAGAKAGYDALLKEYRDGVTQTSTGPRESYPTHYGREWDRSHPAPQGTPR